MASPLSVPFPFLPAIALLLSVTLPPAARAATDRHLGFERPGELTAVKANAAEPVVVEKLRVADCRVGREFTMAPVDGRSDTRPPASARRQYPMTIWDGVAPSDTTEVGLHVRLADRRGFDLVRVEGRCQGTLYRDVTAGSPAPRRTALVAESAGERLRQKLRVTEVASEGGVFRKRLPGPAVTRSLSFFDTDGRLPAEIGFYRIGPPDKPYRAVEEWWLGAPAEAPAPIAPFLAARFGEEKQVVSAQPSAPAAGGAVPLTGRAFVHCVIGPLGLEEGLTALELDLRLEGIPARAPLTVRLQDPLNGRMEMMAAECALSGPGRARLILDFPNQVLPAGAYLWLSVASRDGGQLLTGQDGSRVRLLAVPRDSALEEALAYRKLLLKGCLHRLLDVRPRDRMARVSWSSVETGDMDEDARMELFETLAQCRWLSPEDPEVAEYSRWLSIPGPRMEPSLAGAGLLPLASAVLPLRARRPRLPVEVLERQQRDDGREEGDGQRGDRSLHERDAPDHPAQPQQGPRGHLQSGFSAFHAYFPPAASAAASY